MAELVFHLVHSLASDAPESVPFAAVASVHPSTRPTHPNPTTQPTPTRRNPPLPDATHPNPTQPAPTRRNPAERARASPAGDRRPVQLALQGPREPRSGADQAAVPLREPGLRLRLPDGGRARLRGARTHASA